MEESKVKEATSTKKLLESGESVEKLEKVHSFTFPIFKIILWVQELVAY